MNFDKAENIAKIMNQINRCKNYLQSLDGRSYSDEFVVYYRGGETCDLETEALELLINHYKNKLKRLEDELGKL